MYKNKDTILLGVFLKRSLKKLLLTSVKKIIYYENNLSLKKT